VLPASVAVIPLGLALGVLVVQSGLHWWWAPVFAGAVFAGSLEFLLVGLVAAAAPFAQIAVSALLVNFRHVFYALTFPLHRVQGRRWKAYSTFALTDEAYALTAPADAEGWSRARIITVQAGFHLGWVACVALGAGLGTLIPPEIVGLDFAVTALFVVLGIDAYRIRRSIPVPIVALGCAVLAILMTPGAVLLTAMGLFLAALTGNYFFVRWRRRND
jgi:4-azaleucine resistance transporter AzlC